MSNCSVVSSSFRDPSGFVFTRSGQLYRQVNSSYRDNYDNLMNSGLYESLVEAELLIPHEEVSDEYIYSADGYKVLKPQEIPFISYPYEWCFSQLKEAALTTLRVQKKAFDFGMTLKDSSAYNIQFVGTKPVLIDTLSFERYRQGQIWFGYRQFCQHFLAPLALMSQRNVGLNQLLRIYMDGVPLDMASALLPWRSRLRFSLLWHIHLHARSQRHFADKAVDVKGRKLSRLGFMGLIDSLESAVIKLDWRATGTEWGEYYQDTNYSPAAMKRKEELVREFLRAARPRRTWDLGANTGVFSVIAAEEGSETLSFDIDPAAAEKNYRQCVERKQKHILPLVLDLTNPSGGIGWANEERKSLEARGPADACLALALIHHLAISHNLPLAKTASFLQRLCRTLIIEFVPKRDTQVQRLLASREDIFPQYTREAFEKTFQQFFSICRSVPIAGSERTLYLMEKLC